MSRERSDSSMSVHFLSAYEADVRSYLSLKKDYLRLSASLKSPKHETSLHFRTILSNLHLFEYFDVKERMVDEYTYLVSDIYDRMLRLYAGHILQPATLKQLISITLRDRLGTLHEDAESIEIDIATLYRDYELIVSKHEERKYEVNFEIAIDPCVVLVHEKKRIRTCTPKDARPEKVLFINHELSYCTQFIEDIKQLIANYFVKELSEEGLIAEKSHKTIKRLLLEIIELRIRLFELGIVSSPNFDIKISVSLHAIEDSYSISALSSPSSTKEHKFFRTRDLVEFYRNEGAYHVSEDLRKMKYELRALLPPQDIPLNSTAESGSFHLEAPPRLRKFK